MSTLTSDIETAAAETAQSKVDTAKGALKAAIKALKVTSLADVDASVANVTDGQVIYYDGASKKWKAKTLSADGNKVDKMKGDTANHVVFADGNGGIKDSGKVVGGATLASTPNANTLATEAATKAYADSIQTVWETIA